MLILEIDQIDLKFLQRVPGNETILFPIIFLIHLVHLLPLQETGNLSSCDSLRFEFTIQLIDADETGGGVIIGFANDLIMAHGAMMR